MRARQNIRTPSRSDNAPDHNRHQSPLQRPPVGNPASEPHRKARQAGAGGTCFRTLGCRAYLRTEQQPGFALTLQPELGRALCPRAARGNRSIAVGQPQALLDQAVRPVVVLLEVLRVATRISAPVLWQEDAVGVIGPAGAGAFHIGRVKTVGRAPSATDVLNEPAHHRSVPPAMRWPHRDHARSSR
jgi:hypothetical protein